MVHKIYKKIEHFLFLFMYEWNGLQPHKIIAQNLIRRPQMYEEN